jgi:hypothetical protein
MSQISAIIFSLQETEQAFNSQLAIQNEEIADLKQALKTKEMEISDLKEKLAFWEKPSDEEQTLGKFRQLNPTSWIRLNDFEAERMLQAHDHADRDSMYKEIIHYMKGRNCKIQKREITKYFSRVPPDFTGGPSAFVEQRSRHASQALFQLRLDGIISFAD